MGPSPRSQGTKADRTDQRQDVSGPPCTRRPATTKIMMDLIITKWKKTNSGSYYYDKNDYYFYDDDDTQQKIDYPEDCEDDEETENYWAWVFDYQNWW